MLLDPLIFFLLFGVDAVEAGGFNVFISAVIIVCTVCLRSFSEKHCHAIFYNMYVSIQMIRIPLIDRQVFVSIDHQVSNSLGREIFHNFSYSGLILMILIFPGKVSKK